MRTTTIRSVILTLIFKRFFYTLLLFSFLAVQLFGQSNAELGLPFITNYSTKTFKSLSQVWSVVQGNDGLMYFGVQSSILEYDGIKWRKVTPVTQNASFVVRSLTKNEKGDIYYGSSSDFGYLGKDSLGQTAMKSLIDFVPAGYRDFLDVWSVYSNNEGTYFQSREYIFWLSEKKSDGSREFRAWKPESKFMYSFYLDGTFYVHQQGLGLYKLTSGAFELVPGSEFLGQERMQIMLPYTAGPGGEKQYLVGMFYSGLYIYNGKTFKPFPTQADYLYTSGTLLYKGLLLKNGNYVLSTTGKGTAIIDPNGKLINVLDRSVGLQDESIYGIYQDKNGVLWLGMDNGLSRVDITSPYTQFNLQSGINTSVLSITRFKGTIYIGTTNGLLKYNSSKKIFEPIAGIPQNQIFNLVQVGDELLIPGDGLYSIKDGKPKLLQPSVSGDLSITTLYQSKTHPDLLLAGGTFGIAIFKKEANTGNWHMEGYVKGLSDQIWFFSEDKDGSIWAGTQSETVYNFKLPFDEKGNLQINKIELEEYGTDTGIKNLTGGVINLNGRSYFTTDSTFLTFDADKKKFIPDTTFFTKTSGLSTDGAIYEEKSGRVWIRSGKEVILATRKPGGGYDIEKGLMNNLLDYSFAAFYSDENGIIWLATTDGLIRYDETLVKESNQSFAAIIRHVSLDKKPQVTSSSKDAALGVSYKDNSIRFEYAAPFFEQENRTQFQTWLEGFEDDWSELDNNYYKEYTNLSPGKFTFHVRAVNVFGKQSDEATYAFEIFPPWYRTWWAYLLYVLISGAIIYGVIRWRTRQLHEKHRELEKTVADRTKELSLRVEELGVINSVQEGLVREIEMQGIYNLVGEKIREIFKAQVIDIVTYDKNTNLIEDRYTYEKGDRTLLEPRPLKGFRKHVVETAKPLVINKNVNKEREKYDQTVMIGEGSKSIVLVPMVAGKEVTGVISLQNLDKENAFNDADINLLTTLANSMSVALESAKRYDETKRLLKETEQRTAELAVINSVQEGLAKELEMQSIYELVGNKIRDVFNAQAVIIATLDQATKMEHFNFAMEKGERFNLKPRPYDKLREHLIETKQKILINKDFEGAAATYGMKVLPGTEHPKSLLFVPLISGDKVKSYVSLQNVDLEDAFSDSDVRLMETLANSMSVALENARLFDETNRLLKETEQRTAELAVINSVQEGLAKELDIQGIYELVGDRLCDLFPDTQTLVIRTFNFDTNTETYHYAIEKGTKLQVDPRPLNWSSKEIIASKKPLDIRENYIETAHKHGGAGVTKGQPPKSAVFVPMMVGDMVKGSVSLQNVDKENAFTDSDLRLLTTITNSMSVALENARLFDETNRLLKETEQRTAELAVINSVQEGLVREMNMQAIYDLVGNRICDLFDTQTVLIRTFDLRSGLETWQYVIEKGQRLYSNPRPFNWANKELIKNREPLLINEKYVEIAKSHGGAGVTKGLPPKSALFVPMIVGDIVKGSVSLQNVEKEHAFSESDLRLLTTLTNSMSVALENARLFDESNRLLNEAKQRASELATVNNISQALASQLNIEELIKLVGDEMGQLFKANIVYLALLDKQTNIINFPYQFGDNMAPMKLGEGLTSKIIRTGEALLINKDLQEQRSHLGVQQIGIPAASYLGVPIPVGDEVIGVLSVQSTEQENRFNENDLRLLTTIAMSVGIALRKAKMFEEIQQSKMDAEDAKKVAEKANAAKSAFLSTVSHELRTPLTSVLGFAKIIKKRLEEKVFPITDTSDPKTEKTISQISDNLKVVVSEGERLTHLINDVLDLAKIEAGKMEWNMENVSITEVAERAIAATSALFETNNLALEKNIEPDLPEISGDRDKLIQVMVNLISNSVKFTPKGKVTCSVAKKKDEIVVSISDTGIGIAPEDHAAVFEQFKQVGDTLTDKPKGTGLGLPICKEIIEHHGGRIWLESEFGKGSTFSFALPLTADAVSKPVQIRDLVRQLREQVVQSNLNLKDKPANLLIVDDDDSIRSLLNQELTEAGYIVDEAANGKDALTKIRNKRPDLILLDIMMPEMNGFDVAAVLKNDPKTMDIPIIVLSIVQDKTRGFRIGVDRYLTKPIDTGLLFNEIGSLLEQGKSKKKVMIVDEDSATVNTLTDVLKTKGYVVLESSGNELVEKAVANQPDIIIINSMLSGKQDVVQSLRFEKGLENVLFLVYN